LSNIRDFLVQSSKNYIYLPKINDALLKDQEKNMLKRLMRPKSKNAFYPSGVSHPCRRSLYFQYFNIPGKKKDVRILRIFDNGHSMHARYAKYAKKAGILVACEMPLRNKQYRLRGRLDQIILVNNELYIVDLKSMKDSKFCELYGVPSREYNEQLQLYMWLINDLFEQGSNRKIFKQYPNLFPIKKALLVIENKDNQKQEEILVQYDENCIVEIKKKIDEIVTFVNDSKLPPRDFTPSSQECRWCDFNDYCSTKDEEALITL